MDVCCGRSCCADTVHSSVQSIEFAGFDLGYAFHTAIYWSPAGSRSFGGSFVTNLLLASTLAFNTVGFCLIRPAAPLRRTTPTQTTARRAWCWGSKTLRTCWTSINSRYDGRKAGEGGGQSPVAVAVATADATGARDCWSCCVPVVVVSGTSGVQLWYIVPSCYGKVLWLVLDIVPETTIYLSYRSIVS